MKNKEDTICKIKNVLKGIFSCIATILLVILFFASFGMLLIFALLLTIQDIPNRKNKKSRRKRKNENKNS